MHGVSNLFVDHDLMLVLITFKIRVHLNAHMNAFVKPQYPTFYVTNECVVLVLAVFFVCLPQAQR